MTSTMIELNKRKISDTEIIDIAFDFLLDGHSMSECRGYILSEYGIRARDLEPLLEKATKQVEEWTAEVNGHLRF